MGQYYTPVSLDKKEYLYSWDFQAGLKLMEHSYVRNEFVETVGELLLEGNSWHKTRIVWAGDYGENNALLKGFEQEVLKTKKEIFEESDYYKGKTVDDVKVNVHSLADHTFTKLGNPGRTDKLSLTNVIRYYYNDTSKEYFDIKECPRYDTCYRIHPLPLLTCDCNHSGGSFYYDESKHDYAKYISSWCGDVIFSSRELVPGYEKIRPNFIEE